MTAITGMSRRVLLAGAVGVAGACSGSSNGLASAETNKASVWRAGPRLRDRVGAGVVDDDGPSVARAAGLGMRLVRTWIMWDWVEWDVGSYDFSRYDAHFAAVRAAGVRPLVILMMNNGHYGPLPTPVVSERGIAACARFAEAAAKRYAFVKPIWELSNEPNQPKFWKPQPDAAAYTRLATQCARAIMRADPTAPIIGASLSEIEAPSRDYLAACLDLGLGEVCDAISVHPYIFPPERALSEYRAVNALLARYAGRAGDLGLIQSEWGVPTHTLSREDGAAQTARILLTDWLAGVGGTIFYRLEDAGPDTNDEYDRNYGLLTHDGRPKPGGAMVRAILDAAGDCTEVTRLPTPVGAFALRCTGGPGDVTIGWTSQASMTVRLDGAVVTLTPTPRIL